MKKLPLLLLIVCFHISFSQDFWRPTGGPYGGTIQALVISPSGSMFAATPESGVFRSTDNGDNWTLSNDGLSDKPVQAFAVNSLGHLYAGTTDGIYRSTDNGVSWKASNLGMTNTTVRSLVINFSGHVFAGTANGVFRSIDNGANWTAINTGLTGGVVSCFAITSSGWILAGTSGGIYRSADNGANWSRIALTSLSINSLVVNTTGQAFAGTSEGAYRSTDNGSSWTALQSGTTKYNVSSLAINSTGTLFEGTTSDGMYRSTDNGTTWVQINNGLVHKSITVCAVAPSGQIMVGTNLGGMYRSTDNGANWAPSSRGITGLNVGSLAIDLTGRLYAGTSTGGVYRSTDDGGSWTAINGGLNDLNIRSLAVDSSGILLAGTYSAGIFRSTDQGSSWTQVYSGGRPTFVSSLAWGPAPIACAGIAGGGILRSTDKGITWTQSVSSLPKGTIRSVGTSGKYVFACTDSASFRALLQGNDWEELNPNERALRTAFGVTPDGQIVEVHSGGSVFLSESVGNDISQLFSKPPDTTITSCLVTSYSDLIVGTKNGDIFLSNDWGERWISIRTGLGKNAASTFAFNSLGYVFVGTVAGGVYRSGDPIVPVGAPTTKTSVPQSASSSFQKTISMFVHPHGKSTVGWYEYGADRNLQSTSPSVNVGLSDHEIAGSSYVLYGLTPNTVYYFRAVAQNSKGVTKGVVRTFRTLPIQVSFSSLVATAITSTSATLNGSVGLSPFGNFFPVWFEWSTDSVLSYFDRTASSMVTGGSSSADLQGLLPGTKYFFRIAAIVSGDTVRSRIVGFSTTGTSDQNWVTSSGLYGGEVGRLLVSPTGALFAGTRGGLFRYQGARWVRVANGMPAAAVYSLYAAPVGNSVIMFAGTAEGSFRSTDAGSNWTRVNLGPGVPAVSEIAVNAQYVWAGTRGSGVFKSTDSGETWSQANNGLTNLTILSLLIQGGVNLYAGTEGGGVFRSTDKGATWNPVNTNLTASKVWRIVDGPSGSGYIFAATDGGAFRMTLSTLSWKYVGTGLSGVVRDFVSKTVTWLTDAKHGGGDWITKSLEYVATDNGIFVTDDFGETWVSADFGLPKKAVLTIMASGSNIWAGLLGGGVYRTPNFGADWYNNTVDLNATTVTGLTAGKGKMFAAVDGGGVYRSTDNGMSWESVSNGLENLYALSIAAEGAANLLVGTSQGLYRSTDEGGTWAIVGTGTEGLGVKTLALNASGTIFAGTLSNGIYRSTDKGAGWTQVYKPSSNTDVLSLATNAAGSVYAGMSDGAIYRTTNNGGAWMQLNVTPSAARINGLAVSAAGHVFAATSQAGILRSTDNGDNWTQVNSGIANLNITSVGVNPGGHVVAGCADGSVFRSTDNGGSWTNLNASAPTSIISLAFDSVGYLYTGTYASGVMRGLGPTNPPTVTTVQATNVTGSAVTLNGSLNPKGLGTKVWFEWGTNTALSSPNATSSQQVAGGSTVVSIRADLGGLSPYTTYYYRIVAQNAGGTEKGAILSFTTGQVIVPGSSWQAQSNGPFGAGNINCVLATATGAAFCGTWGGVFRTTDAGQSWTASNYGLTNVGVISLASDPTGVLFAGTLGGVFRSTDNGSSWSELKSGMPQNAVWSLTVSGGGSVLAGMDAGALYRSTNSGTTWTKINASLPNARISSLSSGLFGAIVAGTDGGGIFRSTDNGLTWSQSNTGLGDLSIWSLGANSAGVFFTGTNKGGVFRSTDNGTTWVPVSSGLPASERVWSLAVSDSGDVYTGVQGKLFRTTDGGGSWSEVLTGISNMDYLAIACDTGSTVYAGTKSRGMLLSPDNGMTWTTANKGLANSAVPSLAINMGGQLFAGTFAGVFRSTDYGSSWNESSGIISNSYVFSLVSHPGGSLFAGSNGEGVFRSTNNGQTWSQANGSVAALAGANVYALAVTTSGSLLAGSDAGVFRSTDNGSSWSAAGSGLGNIVLKAIAANASGHLFAGTDSNGVFRSTDNGSTWNQVNTGLTNTRTKCIAVDGSGAVFAGTSGGGVFRSTDNGSSWSPVNTGITDLYELCFASTRNGYLLVGSNTGGVFYTMDKGSTWTQMKPGLPGSPGAGASVLSLAVTDSGYVFAGTAGSSVYRSTDRVSTPDSSNITFLVNTGTVPDTLKSSSFLQIRGNSAALGTLTSASKALLTNTKGDYWRGTFKLRSGDTVQYKFFTNVGNPLPTTAAEQGWEQGTTDPSGYRILVVGKQDSTLPLQFVNGTPSLQPQYFTPYVNQKDSIEVWFRVNMAVNSSFNKSTQYVGIRGGTAPLDWTKSVVLKQESQHGNAASRQYDGTNFWSGYVRFAKTAFNSNVEYKFVILDANSISANVVAPEDNMSVGVDVGSNGNRIIPKGVAGDTTLFWKWWANGEKAPLVQPPAAPALTTPANNTSGLQTTVTLTWGAVSAATSYRVQVSTNTTFTAPLVLDDTSVSINSRQVGGLAENTTYSWRVQGKNAGGSGAWSSVSAFSVATTKSVTSPGIAFPAEPTASTDYRLVSFPGTTSLTAGQVLTGAQNADWRMFRQTAAAVPNHLSELSASASLTTGEGYWMLTKGTFTFAQTVTMPQLSVDGTYSITVRNGWNIIGNPFAVIVTWDAVKKDNQISSNLWSYGGTSGFQQSTTMEPFKGYYVNCSGTSLKVRYPFPTISIEEIKPPAVDWTLQLVLVTESNTDGDNYAGIAPSAKQGPDELDQPKPPGFSDQASLTFSRSSREERLSSDFRPEVGEGQVWSFIVDNPRLQGSSLRILGVETVPPDFETVLIGEQNLKVVDLRKVIDIPLASDAARMKFHVIVGKSGFVKAEVAKYIPQEFDLFQNYPNPFNPTTMITYQLPARSFVVLKVYDALGREVGTLVEAEQGIGRYEVLYDARQLSSGVYFARLQARPMEGSQPGRFSKTMKLMVVR